MSRNPNKRLTILRREWKMSDNEQNASNPVDGQAASEPEGSDEQPVKEGQGLTNPAPADDDIIIK
jgi:hypothetical protein